MGECQSEFWHYKCHIQSFLTCSDALFVAVIRILAPGYVKITYNGRVEFDSGDIGSGGIFRFGAGC
jgi:hypothetical protein